MLGSSTYADDYPAYPVCQVHGPVPMQWQPSGIPFEGTSEARAAYTGKQLPPGPSPYSGLAMPDRPKVPFTGQFHGITAPRWLWIMFILPVQAHQRISRIIPHTSCALCTHPRALTLHSGSRVGFHSMAQRHTAKHLVQNHWSRGDMRVCPSTSRLPSHSLAPLNHGPSTSTSPFCLSCDIFHRMDVFIYG